MINVKINSQIFQLPVGCHLLEALAIYGLKEKVFAIAINGELIPRYQQAQLILQEDNDIDIIIPMQGG
jgi:sulfur carrier protein